jgi:hypothetical protein
MPPIIAAVAGTALESVVSSATKAVTSSASGDDSSDTSYI